MKMVFAVLLPLFIGFSSGVTVPSDTLEVYNKTLSDNNRDGSQKNMTDINLEKSNRIDESELFQTPGKENNLSERSFVFINRRRFNALRNQLSQTNNLNKPFTISARLPQVFAIPPSSVQAGVRPLKQLFNPNLKKTSVSKPWYAPPKYNYIDRGHQNQYKDFKYMLVKVANRAQLKPKLKTIPSINNQKDDNMGPNNSHVNVTMHSADLLHTNSYQMPSYNRHIKFNNRLHTRYQMPNSAFRTRDRSLPEGMHHKENIEPDIISHLYDENNNLLERYIKQTLQDFLRNDSMEKDP